MIFEVREASFSYSPEKMVLEKLNFCSENNVISILAGMNGCGKSTLLKLLAGLLVPDSGEIKLFGRDYTDADVRANIGCLIEAPGCYPNYSVWNNMMLQAANLDIKNPEKEVVKALKMVRMEGAASNKYKNCSLGMKQRIGIAMALLGKPRLLILDEPINGLDADGMRIMREVLVDITKNYQCTVVISSHILGELEKIATHYGIVRGGKMVKEMTAQELEAGCRTYTALQAKEMSRAKALLACKYSRVEDDESGYIRVYDAVSPEDIVTYLYQNGILICEIKTDKIGLEEYYMDLMKEKEGK